MTNGRLKKVTDETDLFDSVFVSAPIGICICSPDGRLQSVNPAFQEFIGYTEAELIAMSVEEITHPEDRNIGRDAHRGFSHSEGNSSTFEKRYVRKNGAVVWGRTNLMAIRNEEGTLTRVVGMVNDISVLKSSLEEKAKLLSLLVSTFDATEEGLIVVDESGRVTAHNRCFAEIWKIPAEILATNDDNIFLGYVKDQLLDPDQFIDRVHMVYRDRDRESSDLLYFKDGRVIARSSQPHRINGLTTGLVWSFRDITAEVKAERAAASALAKENRARQEAENERRRAELLSEASRVLTSSLDFETTLSAITKIILPRLGDWCGIAVVKMGGGMSIVSMTTEPPQQELCDRLKNFIPDPLSDEGIPRAIRTKKALLYPNVNPDLTYGPGTEAVIGTKDPECIENLQRIGLTSYMVLPMMIRGVVIGAVTIASVKPDRHYDELDLGFAEEIVRRCAVAIDNSRLYQDALKTIQAREDFLSVASHELRTPLSPLRMQFEMALRYAKLIPESYADRRDLIDLMEGAGEQLDRLLKLVDTLLDVTRITAGRLSLRLEKTDLVSLFQEAADRFAPMVKKANARIELSLPVRLEGLFDRTRIDQVISNLISNAIKFGDGKVITVTLIAEAGEARFIVRDQGIGIAPQDQERIFGRFERAAPSANYRGLGLGLFIAREIIEAHSGKIFVESTLGKGTTFSVRIPIRY